MDLQHNQDISQPLDARRGRGYPAEMITGRQVRAARVLLGWSVDELTRRSGVGYATVHRIEHTDGVPAVRAASMVAIQRVLEQEGIIFLSPGQHAAGGEGVRLRRTRQ
jgi:transcriptional regulator with XRE-family HTH domain